MNDEGPRELQICELVLAVAGADVGLDLDCGLEDDDKKDGATAEPLVFFPTRHSVRGFCPERKRNETSLIIFRR